MTMLNPKQILVFAPRQDVRFGPLADICAAKSDVRFTPNRDRESDIPQRAMSALPLKADMCGATRDVRFGPIADIGAATLGIEVGDHSPGGILTREGNR